MSQTVSEVNHPSEEAIQAAPAPATTRERTPFTPAERAGFHAQDRSAAAAVAGIVVAIVTIALIGYTIIAVLAMRGPP